MFTFKSNTMNILMSCTNEVNSKLFVFVEDCLDSQKCGYFQRGPEEKTVTKLTLRLLIGLPTRDPGE